MAEDGLSLRWSGRWSLTVRIMAVNIVALAMLAVSIAYLDSFRSRLVDERLTDLGHRVRIGATALTLAGSGAGYGDMERTVAVIARASEARLRVYGPAGNLLQDSWRATGPTYELRDPRTEPWRKHIARFLDRLIDSIVNADEPEPFIEASPDRAGAWAEAGEARQQQAVVGRIRMGPDRTPIANAAAPLGREGDVILMTEGARDITRVVRAERFVTSLVVVAVIAISLLLSFFLARTIARPLRRLALAAQRVKQGRAREVVVPRLPSRRDEIGLLARAVSDMSQALRQRIDATEAFAADVAHELKNPLASLRSAVEAMDRVSDPALKDQLLAVVRDDVHRIDRLITDIAEASRLDAELSRARFEPIDLGVMVEGLVKAREQRGLREDVRLAFGRPAPGVAMVMGEEGRLMRVIENLLDNAISFSPSGGLVQVSATRDGDEIQLRVDDEGPGVPAEAREAIFRRFHSERPENEAFGQHSGLGLAIVRAIVEGHDGRVAAEDRHDAKSGARFTVTLPVIGEIL